ncbi:ADP-glyceromanno-heptose 6-epimerase [Thermithiobacillus plumbiphilus]|uniref:ADP-L-glycero-D-manno-heptose-6-epimerase n=1 Tax=Thermithiobacillus plumbiphilus TaxID=1729899 RepID=A0ABU9DDL0_9PROT
MYIVTGGAGFIGANIVKGLNARGERDILVVDDLSSGDKFRNLMDCEISDYVDKDLFLQWLEKGKLPNAAAVFHEGACSDTMEPDGRYMMNNNYEYSKTLLAWCQAQRVPLLYASSASVYGAGRIFEERREHEAPLNVYGYSKFQFDQFVRRVLPVATAPIVGFRYFNVYGPREQHKGRMASVAFHFFNQMREHGRVRLFQGSDGYADGEQRRDFVYIDDVVKVNFHFLERPDLSGIFNLGTGQAQSFNEVAVAVVNAVDALRNPSSGSRELQALQQEKIIEYIPMPVALHGKYQSFTQASISALRAAGYQDSFHPVQEGVMQYVRWMDAQAQ